MENELEDELRQWRQWVAEVSRGEFLTEDEFLSVYWTRDSLEDALHRLTPEEALSLALLVDPLDEAFAHATVASDALLERKPEAHGRWWWGRVPLRNGPRVFLLRRDMPRPEPTRIVDRQ